MGKVIITITSEQMPSSMLAATAKKFIPHKDQFRGLLLKEYGFSPGQLDIDIEPVPEEQSELDI
jgi:hypothetical protein